MRRFLAAVVLAVGLLAACGGVDEEERAAAVAAARDAYAKARAEGVDLTNGPCIADPLIPGWVADIAHDPRTEIDDDPANQCAGYRAGDADHFVELDPEGNLIRAR